MPVTRENLLERLRRGALILDGAIGTELERRGVTTSLPLWSAAALLECPQQVAAIHADYAQAGAEILVANTFRTNPRTLRRADRLADGPALNNLAVELARQAANRRPGKPAFVAASVAPVADCYRPEDVPDADTLRREHVQMADWLADARPDLIWIETMNTVREARIAAEAAAATGLPFAVSFVVAQTGCLLSGEPLPAAIEAVRPFNPLALGLNCIPPSGLSDLLPLLKPTGDLSLAAYAHINNRQPIRGWDYAQQVSPEDYAGYARRWLELGARIVGGCCGTTPAHIRALHELCVNDKP
ncbi:MAG: homocysteine S-methyltransferase family protein [Planctomycetota bacterium]